MSAQNACDLIFCMALCALPATLCVLHGRRSPLVSGIRRVLIACGIVSLAGWVLCALDMWIAIHVFDDCPDNGFAIFCGYLLSWAYVWVLAIPVFVVYGVLRGASGLVARVSGKGEQKRVPIWEVVLFLLISVAALPILLTLKP